MAFFAGKSASDAIFVYEMMTLRRGSEFRSSFFYLVCYEVRRFEKVRTF